MKLLHLLKEDLKHVSWLLLLNAFLAAMLAYPFSNLADGLIDPETGLYRLQRMIPFLLILYFLITGILTQRLLGKDSLCDVDAFWLSKPFDGLQLLASKAIILFVVYICIPWIFVWSIANNSGVNAPWGALVWHGYWTLWFAPALVFFAVHTKGLSTMLVAATAFATTLFVGYNFFVQFYIFGGRPEMGGFFHLAACLFYLITVTASIVLPFFSRRIGLPRKFASVGILVTIAIPLLGLKGYIGPSERIVENEAIGQALAIEEPVFNLNPDVESQKNLTMEKNSLEIGNVPEKLLFHVDWAQAAFRAPGKPAVAWSSTHSNRPEHSLAKSLSELGEWDIESVYGMRSSRIDIGDNFQLSQPRDIEDGNGSWDLKISLQRYVIENVAVVPFEDGQEIVNGGIRTVLRQAGSATDYSMYMLIQYSYHDLTASQPIQFHSSAKDERLGRVYFLKGKSGRLWQRKSGLSHFPVMGAIGFKKSYGFVGTIEPLMEGVDNEELELVAIDVRSLGKINLETDATLSQ